MKNGVRGVLGVLGVRGVRGVRGVLGVLAVLAVLVPADAFAQDAQPAPAPLTSRLWLVAGAASATVRGTCQTCEEETPYRHSGSVLGALGYRVTDRMDAGAEVFWVPTNNEDGHVRTTHVDAVAQFRPWASRGFFLKAGAGMAFVRNWVDAVGPSAINSKALSIVVGGGWHFRPAARIGVELFAAQHAAAIGDIKTADADVPDVMANFWSVGVALVIR